MNKQQFEYEPPKAKVYRFNSNERILTESGIPEPSYATASLNELFGGINTTFE